MSTATVASDLYSRTFGAARHLTTEKLPYLATAILSLRVVLSPGLGTLAVDNRWRLYVDPDTVVEWGVGPTSGVLAHEVGHVLRDHHARADAHGATNPQAWNLAGDAAINADLREAGIDLPDGVIYPETLGCLPGMTTEQMYDRLIANGDKPLPNGIPTDGGSFDAEQGCGSGAGVPGPSCEAGDGPAGGDGDDAEPGLSETESDLMRRKVAQDVADHITGNGRGSVPAGYARWAEKVLEPPAVDWRQVLAGAVRRGLADAAGRLDYSYRRLPRRRIPGVVTPGMRKPKVTLATVFDTSGSMSRPELQAGLREVEGIARQAGLRGQQHRLYAVDAKAGPRQYVDHVSKIELTGGGGTDMRVGIDKAISERPRPDVVLVLTDCGTPWPAEKPRGVKVIVGAIAPEAHLDAYVSSCPEWATVVRIPVENPEGP